jgi:glyoxylase-like metal-dependent hydrolase (beta-lactamase superfamily II)
MIGDSQLKLLIEEGGLTMTQQLSEKPVKRGRRILKIALYVVLAIIVLIGIAAYVLLAVSPVPKTSEYEVDLAFVRQLAMEGDGPLPVRLNAMIVADGAFPKVMVIAGSGFQEQRMAFPSFQVVYEEDTIIVDAAHSQAEHEAMFPGKPYDSEKFEVMQTAMRESRLILATHEHFDHIGGLAKSPYLDEIREKVILTREQIDNAGPETGFTHYMLAKFTALEYDKYHLIAPGIVLIKAAGHTPGSQMIYVRLQDGTEYLLVGDVVWNSENLERLTGRPWLTSLFLNEDRKIHGHQIRTLYNIAQNEPINLVISHDGEQIEEYMRQGLLGSSFEL